MKNLVTLFALILTISATAFAQDIEIVEDTVFMGVPDPNEFEIVGHAYWINTTSNTITYKWIRDVMCITEGWQSLICDENACYPPNTGTNEITLAPGDTSRLDVHIRPNGIAGSAVVNVILYDVTNPDFEGLGHFVFESECTVGTFVPNVPQMQVAPNPSQGNFTVTDQPADLHSIIVADAQGRTVRTLSAQNGNQYNLTDLPNGLYSLRLIGNKGNTVGASRLIIQQ